MKTCVTCKHYDSFSAGCTQQGPWAVSPVYGTKYYRQALEVRRTGLCGPTGLFHEPKPDNFLVRIGKWALRIK